MGHPIETRTYRVNFDVIGPLSRELDARTWLTYSVRKPSAWLDPIGNATFTVNGPAFALDDIIGIIERMEYEAFVERQW